MRQTGDKRDRGRDWGRGGGRTRGGIGRRAGVGTWEEKEQRGVDGMRDALKR